MRFESFEIRKVGPFENLKIELPKKTIADEAEVHIFTGTNGTGKSTLLRCFSTIAPNAIKLLQKRFWPLNDNEYEEPNSKFKFFPAKHDWLGTIDSYQHRPQPNHIYNNMNFGPANPIFEAVHQNYNQDYLTLIKSGGVEFAAFGYAGGRTLNSTGLTSISEVTVGPFQNALSFDSTVNPAQLIQWIASVKTKEAMAFRQGKSEKVLKHENSTKRIETAISEMIDMKVSFHFEDEPTLQVKIKVNEKVIDFDVLPDGLKSILSWLADLLMRLDRIPWKDSSVDVLAQPFALFLDEVDVHLHPKWQRKVLRAAKKLFPNSQIFVATHSPFVVSSVEGGWIHRLEMQPNGLSNANAPIPSQAGHSYEFVIDEIFGIESRFDAETEKDLALFKQIKSQTLKEEEGSLLQLRNLGAALSKKSPELENLIELELRQVYRILKLQYEKS